MVWLASSGNAGEILFVMFFFPLQRMWFCHLFKKKEKGEKKGADHVMIKQNDIAHWLWRDKGRIHRHRGVGESPNEKHTLQLHD